MVSFEFLAVILTGLGLTASIVYYASILRNANKTQEIQLETRQAQLYMEFYRDFKKKEFQNDFYVAMDFEFKDFNDFIDKTRGSENRELFLRILNFGYFIEGLGVLLYRKMIDPSLIDELMGGNIIRYGDKYRPIIDGFRKTNPSFGEWGVYLVDEMKKMGTRYTT